MSVAPPLEPIENQVTAPGAGDVDDCWVVALRRAIRQVGLRAPSITDIRYAAGVPDIPGHVDGAAPSQVLRAARALAPAARPVLLRGFDTMIHELRFSSAVIFYRAGRLPSPYQYGFTGLHAGGLDQRGTDLYISDPLAPSGSSPKRISDAALRPAMEVYPGGVSAILLEVVPMSMYESIPRPGTFIIPARRAVKGYDWAATGWAVVKTWDPRPTPSSARFDAHLLRRAGTTTPSSLLHVIDGYFRDLYVDTSVVVESHDPTDTKTVQLVVDGVVISSVEI